MRGRPAVLQSKAYPGDAVRLGDARSGVSARAAANVEAANSRIVEASAPALPQELLRLDSIRKRYGDYEALHGVSLSVERGEFLALVGPSGSGKSTLLKIISGFEAASEGAVIMDGADVTAVPAADRPTNMVFQKLALWPHMTVAENIAFPLKLRRIEAAERARRVEEMMALMHLNPAYRERYPTQLSGGEQQRVALARAMWWRTRACSCSTNP